MWKGLWSEHVNWKKHQLIIPIEFIFSLVDFFLFGWISNRHLSHDYVIGMSWVLVSDCLWGECSSATVKRKKPRPHKLARHDVTVQPSKCNQRYFTCHSGSWCKPAAAVCRSRNEEQLFGESDDTEFLPLCPVQVWCQSGSSEEPSSSAAWWPRTSVTSPHPLSASSGSPRPPAPAVWTSCKCTDTQCSALWKPETNL